MIHTRNKENHVKKATTMLGVKFDRHASLTLNTNQTKKIMNLSASSHAELNFSLLYSLKSCKGHKESIVTETVQVFSLIMLYYFDLAILESKHYVINARRKLSCSYFSKSLMLAYLILLSLLLLFYRCCLIKSELISFLHLCRSETVSCHS